MSNMIKCPIIKCLKQFTSSSNLATHLHTAHSHLTMELSVLNKFGLSCCLICGSIYTTRGLNTHMLFSHHQHFKSVFKSSDITSTSEILRNQKENFTGMRKEEESSHCQNKDNCNNSRTRKKLKKIKSLNLKKNTGLKLNTIRITNPTVSLISPNSKKNDQTKSKFTVTLESLRRKNTNRNEQLDKTQCIICTEFVDKTEYYSLPCLHSIHKKCLCNMVEISNNNKCPICFAPFYFIDDICLPPNMKQRIESDYCDSLL